jgi:beta-N-acetylhexosaminidase
VQLTVQAKRLAIAGAVLVVLLGAGIYLLFLRGGDDTPVVEAGSRFGNDSGRGTGGTLMDTLAPILGATGRNVRGGSDPDPPSVDELGRAPQDAVAGLFMVGFAGKDSSSSFFERLKARPYGGVLLSRANYTEPQQLSKLTLALQKAASAAGQPAPIIAAQQEGGSFNAFGNLAPSAQVDVGNQAKGTRDSALGAGRQLRALGVGMTFAPNADLAVAGGPGQGRAFSDRPAKVTSAVRAAVSAYRQAKVVSAVGPFPGDGGASQDPAEGPAPVGLSIDDLRKADMTPFIAVATGDKAVPAIQMSNAIYAAWDGVTPATLLPDAIDELRDRIGFQGTIVSANLVATTATTGGSVGKAAVDAIKAGVDLLVVPGGRAQQDEAYRAVVAAVRSRAIKPQRVVDALRHIAALRALTKDSRDPVQVGG